MPVTGWSVMVMVPHGGHGWTMHMPHDHSAVIGTTVVATCPTIGMGPCIETTKSDSEDEQ